MTVTASLSAAGAYREANGLGVDEAAGLRSVRVSPQTGSLVSVYDALEAGIEDDPEGRWASVCETHGTLVCHTTLALATGHAADPAGWCGECETVPRLGNSYRPGCPHGCRGGRAMDWIDDAWICPSCRDEWYPENADADLVRW